MESGLRISRRHALVAGVWAGFALLTIGYPAARATPEAGLRGIGLTEADFAARYPKLTDGQGAGIYRVDGIDYYITNTTSVDTDRVVSVYWGSGTPDNGVPFDDAQRRLVGFLPGDALLTQVGAAPGAGIGPRLRVDVYNSAALASVMRGSGFVDSGDVLLAYVYANPFQGTVSSANAYVAVKS